jgi:hypothetical protein
MGGNPFRFGTRKTIHGYVTSNIERDQVVRDLFSPLEGEGSLGGIKGNHLVPYEYPSAGFHHVLNIEPYLFGLINAGNHARAHTRIVVKSIRADQGNLGPSMDKLVRVLQGE